MSEVVITGERYKELLRAEIILSAIQRMFEADKYVQESNVRAIAGWNEPRDLDVMDFSKEESDVS